MWPFWMGAPGSATARPVLRMAVPGEPLDHLASTGGPDDDPAGHTPSSITAAREGSPPARPTPLPPASRHAVLRSVPLEKNEGRFLKQNQETSAKPVSNSSHLQSASVPMWKTTRLEGTFPSRSVRIWSIGKVTGTPGRLCCPRAGPYLHPSLRPHQKTLLPNGMLILPFFGLFPVP